MQKTIVVTALSAALAACATGPLSDAPIDPSALSSCNAIADRHTGNANLGESPAARDVLTYAGAGAITGAAIDGAAKRTFFLNGISQKVVVHFGSVLLPFTIAGALIGANEAAKTHERIVRECLRDKGFKVY